MTICLKQLLFSLTFFKIYFYNLFMYIGADTLRVQKKALGPLDPGFGTWVTIGT